ncbi:MAG: EAL domain-containing protein [Rhodocyclaceae bacterium]|nr:EAL domain-containing protein [Rhodocyclaceae bacterium]
MILPLLALALVLAGVRTYAYLSAKNAVKHNVAQSLEAISKLKAGQIEQWQSQRIDDAQLILTQFFVSDLRQWLVGGRRDQKLEQRVLLQLKFVGETRYLDLSLHSPDDGALLLTTNHHPDLPAIRAQALACAKSAKPLIEDIHASEVGSRSATDAGLFYPVSDTDGTHILAVLHLSLDPGEMLFPLLQTWPGISESAETLLVRREDKEVVFINQLRHSQAGPLQLRRSLAMPQLIAPRVIKEGNGFFEGQDYRGIPSLGYGIKVANTPWYLVAKIDQAEVYADTNAIMAYTSMIFALVLAACAWWLIKRRRAETDLRIAAAAFDSQEGIIVTDANSTILRANRAFCASTGYTPEELVGQTPRLFKSGRHNADFFRDMWDAIQRTGGWQGEIWDRRKNGEVYPKWLTISTVKAPGGSVTNYISMHTDISERKRAEEKINQLAFFDQLTALPNRTLLLDRLRQAITAGTRSDAYGALLFIDLDNFKTLNDSLGHHVGDQLLKQIAQRLAHGVREGDTVARLGGDEFVLILAGLSNDEQMAANSAETVAEKILAALNQTYQLGEVSHHGTASIGITLFKGDQASIDDLMKQADLAMYNAKTSGRNLIRFFDPSLEISVKERAALESGLRRALEEKQFLFHYQAQVAGAGRVTGAEVLMRWQHPQRGLLSPVEFIPLAEETGLILPMGQWALETACTQLALWAAQPALAHLVVAVNVSARQFHQDDFVDQVLAILQTTGANPQRLKIELTESLLVEKVEDMIAKMTRLKAKGVGFSLDDFGTGYSSLSYLKRMPLDQLKIDRSFVRDILTDPNDAAIARTIVALAESLGLDVIAEGVETETQCDCLTSLGCQAYQGYLYSRPVPLAEFELYVRKTDSAPAGQPRS